MDWDTIDEWVTTNSMKLLFGAIFLGLFVWLCVICDRHSESAHAANIENGKQYLRQHVGAVTSVCRPSNGRCACEHFYSDDNDFSISTTAEIAPNGDVLCKIMATSVVDWTR